MVFQCPQCKARHDASMRAPGERFDCACGHEFQVPKRGRAGRWIVLAVVGLGLVVSVLIATPNFVTYGPRQKAGEARICLAGIRAAELSYLDTYQTLLAAGPVPAAMPSGVRVPFAPDQGFRLLQWQPEGFVYHQYEVRLTGPRTAVATARGDIDRNGEIAQYRLVIDADDRSTRVEALTPDEY